MDLIKDTKYIIADLPDLMKKGFITSFGFTILILSKIVLHVLSLSMRLNLTQYIAWELLLWLTLTILFIPSMIVREFYKKRDDVIMNKLNLILEALKK